MNKHCIRKCSTLSNEAYKNELISIENSTFINDETTDTQIHVGVDKNNIYIVCRGTSSYKDVITDLKIWRKKCIFLENTLIHSGFLEQYTAVRKKVHDEIELIMNDNIKRVVFCGHSLGGALATIAALDYKLLNKTNNIECITFASPRVGSKSFAKLFNKIIDTSHRIVYHRDPVTFLPTCIRFKHVKGCIHFKKNGKINISDDYFLPVGCLVSQHFMDKYKERVNEWLDNEVVINIEV